jgi:hypothetical protein
MEVIKKPELPKIVDLYENRELAQKENVLNVLLNQPPKAEWIKKHPMTHLPYIPIDVVEYLLTSIFQTWWVEVKEVKLIANSVCVTIRLWVKHPLSNEAYFQDGVGAVPLQTDKDCGACDFDKIKSAAVQIGAPAAESYAIKDAAEKFGKLFGKDLNRKDEINYNVNLKRFDAVKEE